MSVPSREEFDEILEQAQKARQAAAKEAFEKLPAPVRNFPDMVGACGGARTVLKVDGRSALGRFLATLTENPLPNGGVGSGAGGFTLYFRESIPYQHAVVNEAGEEAALEVIKTRLGIDGYVRTYFS
jgi:hypothetical protein